MGRTIQVYGFPSSVTAQSVKNSLESLTGAGTIYALKVRTPKNGGLRVYAIVQFTTSRSADSILRLASLRRLWYGGSYLKAREMEQDIVPQPRTIRHSMKDLTLHFGCQVSTARFSSLWRRDNVSLNFGIEMRKFHFLLSYGKDEYRLELSYEDIWQIELHSSPSNATRHLLIQMFGAPRVFKKDVSASGLLSGFCDYFKDGSEDQWMRATDFTPDCSMGQSSTLCLELPPGLRLPDFRGNFANYKEIKSGLVLVLGFGYSRNQDLVPIVGPSPDFDLPYNILFKINLLVQNGCLPGPNLDAGFYRLVDPRRISPVWIEHALEKLYHVKECCYTPSRWLQEEYKKNSRKSPRSPNIALSDGLVYVHRVQVTPLKVYFFGPEVNVSNRVLRRYSADIDNFLRVSFVDEDLDKIHSNVVAPRSSSERRTEVFKRILSVLQDGITIGDKRFEFLAFSSSQLRENSAWMFASHRGLTAEDIRRWMGDFSSIRNVAKYAARLGQSFGSSTETLTVRRAETELIPDIEVTRHGTRYVFSDGIGKISSEFAKKVAMKCGLHEYTPSAFQIRYGGSKGVVAVDPTASKKLSLRKSMHKYESNFEKLDVLAWSKYQPCFMNRQVITLLSTLGIKDHVFEKKQKEAVDQLNAILTDPLRAREALDLIAPGETTNVLKAMLDCGYEPDVEPFLSMMLQTFRAAKLLELRTKSRIFIPNGRCMMGCLDETGTLEYGEVFILFRNSPTVSHGSHKRFVITGKVAVAKNPCLHPGDVRVLKAVNIPALHHMVDCVVFPQRGWRPHPNECSGSDLDGDVYFVCWDPELIPPKSHEPMDYTPPPPMTLDHDVTVKEVQEYFANYIVNDSLGIIANAHTVFADREPLKALSEPCIELARKFSIAVDFPKTGVPAEIPSHLHVKEYPDFMEKPDKPTYESRNVIGKLFRQVKDIAPHTNSIRCFTREVARRSYDPDMEYDGFEDYIDDAIYHKGNYDYKLGNLMDYYGIKTEAELLSGNIMKMSKSFTKKRDAESIRMAVRSLRKEARSWFNENASDFVLETDEFAKASAWYHATYHPDYWGTYNEGLSREHFLSFPWCVYDKLVQIKKRSQRWLPVSSLADQFGRGLRFF